MSRRVFHRAAVLHFVADPQTHGDAACEYFPDGGLLIEDGRVAAAGPAESLAPNIGDAMVVEHANAMIAPGFVDAHVHFPQIDIVAAYGESLLEWLNRYAFPAEAAFADKSHCAAAAEIFLDSLLANGTTSALVFATSHAVSVDVFFAAAAARGLRMAAGKVMMNRNAPAALTDTTESSLADSQRLIDDWHGRDRLTYAVTPRFAITSDGPQLAAAGKLLRDNPTTLLHTHLSENTDELAAVGELFPEARNYLDVYARHGLVCERSVFAHAVHLGDEEWRALAAAKSSVAFCPTSNFFLGSGLFDAARARRFGASVALGTDIGGGTSFSLFRVMDEAHKCARLRGDQARPYSLWHWATLGGAQALRWDKHVGNFAVGKEADFIVLDMAATPLLRRRLAATTTLEEKLFIMAVLGDDRLIRRVYIMGEEIAEKRQKTL